MALKKIEIFKANQKHPSPNTYKLNGVLNGYFNKRQQRLCLLYRVQINCGVYWTKFECISGKIRRILTTNRTRGARGDLKLPRTLRLRGEANQCASDTLADSRVQKPKNFLAFSSRLLPPPLHREAEKEMERKFLVLLRHKETPQRATKLSQ